MSKCAMQARNLLGMEQLRAYEGAPCTHPDNICPLSGDTKPVSWRVLVLFPLSKTRPSPSLSPHASSQSSFFRGIEDTVPLPLVVATPPIIASEHLSCHHPTYSLSTLSAQRDRWWFFSHYRALLPHSPECCGSRPWYKEGAPP